MSREATCSAAVPAAGVGGGLRVWTALPGAIRCGAPALAAWKAAL